MFTGSGKAIDGKKIMYTGSGKASYGRKIKGQRELNNYLKEKREYYERKNGKIPRNTGTAGYVTRVPMIKFSFFIRKPKVTLDNSLLYVSGQSSSFLRS